MKPSQKPQDPEFIRVKTPKGRQVLGLVEQRLGGSRMRIRGLDGVTRICRIPGRLKRKLWIREGDILLVEPWEYDNNKGDVLFKYRPSQIDWLKKKGYLKGLEDIDEF